jgi:Ca-activated chloride channel homolog
MAKHRCSSPRWLAMLAALAVGTVVEGQRAPFRSGVALVPLTVTVTDGRGEYVNDLSRHHFTVLEDGVPQTLAFFASDPVPVDLALVLDVSGSMRQHLPIVRRAAGGLIRSLRAGDRVTVAALDTSITVVQPLTDDLARADGAIREIAAKGSTALYDGLYVMLRELERARHGRSDVRRQTLVLLSDGLDTASHLGFDDVQRLAQRARVNIYVIAVPGAGRPLPRAEQDARALRAGHELRALARQAGGRSFFPQSMEELPAVYGDVARELANQYELAYLPSASVGDGAFRRVTVRVGNAVARTRSGYVASAPSGRSLDAVGTAYAGPQP